MVKVVHRNIPQIRQSVWSFLFFGVYVAWTQRRPEVWVCNRREEIRDTSNPHSRSMFVRTFGVFYLCPSSFHHSLRQKKKHTKKKKAVEKGCSCQFFFDGCIFSIGGLQTKSSYYFKF